MAATKDRRSPNRRSDAKANSLPAQPSHGDVEVIDSAGQAGEKFEAFFQAAKQSNELAAKIAARLQALGFSGITTREQFRDAVKGSDLTTENGAKKFAELLALSRDFASLTPAIGEEEVNIDPPQHSADSKVDNIDHEEEHKAMTDLTRQEVDAKLGENAAKVDARLANFDTSIQAGFAELRIGFADLRADMAKQGGDMRTEMANLRTEIHRNTIDLIKLAVGIAIAGVGMTVGLLTYINKPTPPTALQSAPAAVIAPAPQPTPATPGVTEFRTNPPK